MKKAVVADIDGTQLREDIPKTQYSAQDLAHASALRNRLDYLSSQGVLIVHATNRMAEFVLEDIGLLAKADYITCSASTRILKYNRQADTYADDPDYDALVQSCNFDPEVCREQMSQFPELHLTPDINQTDRKVSCTFTPGTPIERRVEIEAALQQMQPPTIKIFMVEDRDNHIIDFLPAFCTKAATLAFIMKKEKLEPEDVIAFGNSNNDIPLLGEKFTSVAVGDSRPSLLEHVEQMKANGSKRHHVAPLENTQGVLWGLDLYGMTAKP